MWKTFQIDLDLHFINRYTYELLIVPGHEINGTKPLLTIEAKSSPIHVHPNDLGGSDAALKEFTFGVRLKSEYVSPMHTH